jgi:penicillin-binding protein 1C
MLPPDLSRLGVMGTEVDDAAGRPLALLPAPGGVWRFRTSAGEVSPALLDMLIAVEDRRFWLHPGVDPVALVRAVGQMLRAGRVVSGGSTLAMQAARLLHPRPRTVRSKLIEMARALQLEMRYGRAGVLDIWLTLAPFGGNLEGVRAGSMAWLGVPPTALEPAQAALLVAIPRRPEALRPDRHPAAARAVVARILATAAGGVASRDVMDEAAMRRHPMPRHAAQIVAALPRRPVVRTTLDLPLQIALERLAQERLQTLPPRVSLAIVIADVETRAVSAAFAGAWRDEGRAGALDLTRAVRSPGSALKPFIYAMAFADGIAGPETRLADLPHRYGAYAPENFDRGFAGSVTAAEALRRSLNLPAVALLDQVGALRFAATLKQAGAMLRLPPGADPSLPLALGGEGITLREVVGLYAALASDGSGGTLRLLADDPRVATPFRRRLPVSSPMC